MEQEVTYKKIFLANELKSVMKHFKDAATTDVKGTIIFICYKWISVFANEENRKR